MASKFAEFIEQNKIDPRRILVSSQQLERLRPEDRAIKLAKAKSGEEGAAKKPADDENKEPPKKPRSGRPVTQQLLDKASAGKGISGPAKTRIVRAVNRILEQKKKDAVAVRDLF